MKCNTFDEAVSRALPIFDDENQNIGSLVPVGPWILADKPKILEICNWRQKAMRFFLTQFESTFDRTYGYLENLSIGQKGRIFFLIYDQKDEFIGHIGLSDIDGKTGELDNLMRGKGGGDPQLIRFSEKTLLSWGFGDLGLQHMSLQIISFNALTINLHSSFGFKTVEKYPLFKSEKDGFTIHEPVPADKANVRYTSVLMEADREGFLASLK